jgi:hypothetical protein
MVAYVDKFSQMLHRFRNHYSLTAVIQGVKASGLKTEALNRFGKLLNPGGYYQYHQNAIIPGGALHYLLPALRGFTQGDMTCANVVIRDSAFYTLRVDHPRPEMRLSPQGLVEAIKDTVASHKNEASSQNLSFVNVVFACFK